jgi:hypothetical protein
MLRTLTAPLMLLVLAFSLSGCIFPGYYHHDRYEGGGYGGGGYDHGGGDGGYHNH